MKKVVIGISGASGVILGIRLLEQLQYRAETHLILTDTTQKIVTHETGYSIDAVQKLADYSYCNNDFFASVASGSFFLTVWLLFRAPLRVYLRLRCHMRIHYWLELQMLR